jgi:hypothetical protein
MMAHTRGEAVNIHPRNDQMIRRGSKRSDDTTTAKKSHRFIFVPSQIKHTASLVCFNKLKLSLEDRKMSTQQTRSSDSSYRVSWFGWVFLPPSEGQMTHYDGKSSYFHERKSVINREPLYVNKKIYQESVSPLFISDLIR